MVLMRKDKKKKRALCKYGQMRVSSCKVVSLSIAGKDFYSG